MSDEPLPVYCMVEQEYVALHRELPAPIGQFAPRWIVDRTTFDADAL